MKRYESLSLRELLEAEEQGELELPNFQREFVWDYETQRELIASFIVDIPIGSILRIEGQGSEFAVRKLCYKEGQNEAPKQKCKYLLDGQQRIATLKSCFCDLFGSFDTWDQDLNDIYHKLRKRWFLNLLPPRGGIDFFGIEELYFDRAKLLQADTEGIKEHIEYRHIYKKYRSRWYNPGYATSSFEDPHNNESVILNEIAKHAAHEYLVPLFSIGTSSDGPQLHDRTIQKIAYERTQEIQAEVADDPDYLSTILSRADPSIDDYIQSDDQEKIDAAWEFLKTKWMSQVTSFFGELLEREVPGIDLDQNEIDKAVSIFDNLNKGGTPLSTFDLIVARAALENPTSTSLTEQIVEQLTEEIEIPSALAAGIHGTPSKWSADLAGALDENPPPIKVFRTQYLNVLSLTEYLTEEASEDLSNLDVQYIKKKKQLDLSSTQINNYSVIAVQGLIRALCFLQIRCGIISVNDVPYKLMVLPIAVVFQHEALWNDRDVHNKVEYWYWSAIFSGTYRENQNPTVIEDIKQLLSWVNDDCQCPFTNRESRVLNEPTYCDESILLRETREDERKVPKPIESSILHYILSNQPIDLLDPDQFSRVTLNAWDAAQGQTFSDVEGNEYRMDLQKHHICPIANARSIKDTADRIRDEDHVLDSPLNKTYISAKANNTIGNLSEKDYIQQLDRMSLLNHFIPDSDHFTRSDDEDHESYYKRVLKERYNILRRELINELRRLKS